MTSPPRGAKHGEILVRLEMHESFDLVEILQDSPETVTDRELAKVRRSVHTGPTLLRLVVEEQAARRLLFIGRLGSDELGTCYRDGRGYLPEKIRRLRDYDPNKISPRFARKLV